VTELAQSLAGSTQAQDAAETVALSALGEFVKDYDGRIKFRRQSRIIGAESDEMEPTTDVSVSSSTEG
jgi:hypothetical protein